MVGKDINSIVKNVFLSTAACYGFFCTEDIIRKKWSSTEQA